MIGAGQPSWSGPETKGLANSSLRHRVLILGIRHLHAAGPGYLVSTPDEGGESALLLVRYCFDPDPVPRTSAVFCTRGAVHATHDALRTHGVKGLRHDRDATFGSAVLLVMDHNPITGLV